MQIASPERVDNRNKVQYGCRTARFLPNAGSGGLLFRIRHCVLSSAGFFAIVGRFAHLYFGVTVASSLQGFQTRSPERQ